MNVAHKLWNRPPQTIRESDSLSSLKSKRKQSFSNDVYAQLNITWKITYYEYCKSKYYTIIMVVLTLQRTNMSCNPWITLREWHLKAGLLLHKGKLDDFFCHST